MIYRLHLNHPRETDGEKWFAHQIDGQFGHLSDAPLPEELKKLLLELSGASERPSS